MTLRINTTAQRFKHPLFGEGGTAGLWNPVGSFGDPARDDDT